MDRVIDSTAERLALPCVLWDGPEDEDGYGKAGSKKAHRVAWEAEHGPIPKGLELDHICVVRLCVALYHLDLVTHAENVRRMVERGNHWKQKVTHCPAGHDYADPVHGVVYGGKRYCRTCRREQMSARRSAGKLGSVSMKCETCGRGFGRVPSSTQRFCSFKCGLPARANQTNRVRGERHGRATLRDEDVRAIRRLLAAGCSQREAGEMFGVNQVTIGRLARGITWSHVV